MARWIAVVLPAPFVEKTEDFTLLDLQGEMIERRARFAGGTGRDSP